MSSKANPAFVAALVAARRSGTRLVLDPETVPADIPEAFAVQTAVAHALGARVAGWKVGFAPDSDQPVAAPMFQDGFRAAGGSWKLPANAPLIVEVEIAFRLARDLPLRDRPYTREEILAAADAVLIGLELIASRVGEAKDVPYPTFLADNIGNLGYVTGDEIRDFAALDLTALRCRLRLDGEVVHDAVGGHPQRDPVEPLRAWASCAVDGLAGLRQGQIVTTGSLSGVTRVHRPAVLDADIEGIGAVTLDVR
jgi:2-keto-4-pentenoate hydratase